MPVPGHVPAALDPDLDSDTWPYLVTVAVAGLQLTLLPPPNLTLPGLASAPATGTLCWSPLPFLGLPCVSLRYLTVALVTADFHETSILSAKALHCWAGMRLLGSLESSVLC